jgi:peptide/nickel transport system substrate-binding protein
VARLWIALILILAVGIAWAGPGDNSLVIGTSQEPTVVGVDFGNLNALGSQAIKSEVQLWTTAGVYRVNLDANLEPGLVTEVATVENGRMSIEASQGDAGAQRVVKTLTLRDDVRWSDGQPITTDDIAFYYELGKAPGMPTASPDYWSRVSLRVIDGLTFEVTFDPAQSSDLVGSPMEALPAHVMRPAWTNIQQSVAAAGGDGARISEIYRGFFTDFGSSEAVNAGRMVYSGPFVPTRWTPGSTLEMARNPHFADHPANQDAYVQRVSYRFITDTNALLFSIVSGAVDVTSNVAITFDQAISPQIQARARDRYDVWFVPGAIWEHLEVNQFTNVPQVRDLKLDDVRTRRAIIHAIDRQSMSDALFNGLQPVSHANVSPFDPTYNPDLPQYDYDPEQSAALLAELGWTRASDGILQRTADGRTIRFELEFVTTAGNAVRERQQQFIAEDLRQVGIDVRINNAPSNVVFAPAFSQRAYEGAWTGMFMFAWLSSQASSLNSAGYLCRNAPTPANDWSGQNYAGTCVPEWDELRDRAVAELNLEVSRPIYQEMQRVFAENLMAIPLFFRTAPYVVSKGVVNYVASTFNQGFGYPPPRPELVGWESRGAEMVFDQADYGLGQ